MSDEDNHFESKADAGASKTFPQQAGTIRKNGYIVIKGRPCKVSVLIFDFCFSRFYFSSFCFRFQIFFFKCILLNIQGGPPTFFHYCVSSCWERTFYQPVLVTSLLRPHERPSCLIFCSNCLICLDMDREGFFCILAWFQIAF